MRVFFSHLEVWGTNRRLCSEGIDFQVREYIRTWNAKTLVIKQILF